MMFRVEDGQTLPHVVRVGSVGTKDIIYVSFFLKLEQQPLHVI